MPYLLRGIDVAEEDMRASVINTLISVAEEQSAGEGDVISEHASTIIAALLKNADHRITPSPVGPDLAEACVIHGSTRFPQRLREASLRCLGLIPSNIQYSILHPHKKIVLGRLAIALDDPKRAVRKEAVDAR